MPNIYLWSLLFDWVYWILFLNIFWLEIRYSSISIIHYQIRKKMSCTFNYCLKNNWITSLQHSSPFFFIIIIFFFWLDKSALAMHRLPTWHILFHWLCACRVIFECIVRVPMMTPAFVYNTIRQTQIIAWVRTAVASHTTAATLWKHI